MKVADRKQITFWKIPFANNWSHEPRIGLSSISETAKDMVSRIKYPGRARLVR